MDDALELPSVAPPSQDQDAGLDDDDDEGGALDWSKLNKLTASSGIDRPIIPKRGEKEYEPSGGPASTAGSNLQNYVLDNARKAMYTALSAQRGISSKSISYGIWYPRTAHAEVLLARGTLFAALGYSNARGGMQKKRKLELLPEEALYMIERGSMYCWRVEDDDHDLQVNIDAPIEQIVSSAGVPMSVQQALAEMIGPKGGLTTEQYQVYAYLKRLGYAVIRAEKPPGAPAYPLAAVPPPSLSAALSRPSFFSSVWNWFLWPFRHLFSSRRAAIDWATSPAYTLFDTNSGRFSIRQIFETLRTIVPGGHQAPLKSTSSSQKATPYKPFYHVYKPSTPFKKTAPPPPDFYLSVVNARTVPLPSLGEMTDVFATLPDMPLPPPMPRKKRPESLPSAGPQQAPKKTVTFNEPEPPAKLSLLARLCTYFPAFSTKEAEPYRNPFPSLKAGKKSFVVAAVDSGGTSFIRFSEGTFEEWPMYPTGTEPPRKPPPKRSEATVAVG